MLDTPEHTEPEARAAPPSENRLAARPGPWGACILLLLACGPYLAAVPKSFVGWDDAYFITGNPLVTEPGGLYRIWGSTDAPQYYPLVFTSHWLEFRGWGGWVGGYYLVNVALHAASALLVTVLARQLGMRPYAALLAGALFAVHPLQAGSVAWLAQRKNTLALMWGLLAFVLYLRQRRSGGALLYGAALGAFLLALLSKTVLVALPPVMLLADVGVLRRGWRGSVLRLAPFLLIAAPLVMVSASVEARIATRMAEPGLRPLIAAAAVWFYLRQIVWPAVLLPVYARWPITAATPAYWIAAAALLVAAGGVYYGRRRLGPVVVWGCVAWLILLAPGLGFQRFGHLLHASVADHLTYVPSFAMVIAVAALVERLASRNAGRPVVWGTAAAVVLIALGAKTVSQARLWADGDRLWAYTLTHNPDSFVAHTHVGWTCLNAGQTAEAEAHFRQALALDPEFAYGHASLGSALAARGDAAGALVHLQQGLALDARMPEAHFTLGVCLADLGQLARAVAAYRAGLDLQPRDHRARANLAMTLQALGRRDEAASEFERSLALEPNQPPLRVEFARLRLAQQRPAEAVAEFERALAGMPADPDVLADYARALRAAGRASEAAAVQQQIGAAGQPR